MMSLRRIKIQRLTDRSRQENKSSERTSVEKIIERLVRCEEDERKER